MSETQAARERQPAGATTVQVTPPTPSEPAAPKETAAATATTGDKQDPVRDLVLRLAQAASEVGRSDKSAARDIQSLAREVEKPGRTGEAVFRTQVAYALQDVEKHLGPIDVAAGLRAELQALGKTYPGLKNERMQDLVAATGAIDSGRLVREIRDAASRVAGRADQHDGNADSLVSTLENRVRLLTQVADQRPAAPTATPPAAPTQTAAGPGIATQPTAPTPPPPQHAPPAREAPRQAQQGRAMLDIMGALRRAEPEAPAPWDRQLTPMGDRIQAYSARMREGAQEQILRSAEKSGQAAIAAMKDFTDGPGAVMMTRIRDAAKTDPNGIAGVLAEMKDGGRYAGLRQDFNVALQQEKSFAAAYERAASGVARFGAERVEVDKIAASRPDVAAIAGRFQKLDAEIGKAASELPGRSDGKSFTDELAERAGEIVRKAVDAVQTAFARIRGTASPSAGPS